MLKEKRTIIHKGRTVGVNASGYDSSDKIDVPSHPVIFTKRATSIIANEEDILLDENFTSSLDYEGEIGVIIGKGGSHITEQNANEHIWGYTIINDITARERQRDHKQFYIRKSADSYCPLGPLAVPACALDTKTMTVTTHVNGQLRQKGSLEDLIFSIPELISTLSQSQTLRPGDVIATGTPAGVGIGRNPPVFLKVGDEIEVSVSGIGTLTNKVVNATNETYIGDRLEQENHIPISNLAITNGGIGLTTLPCGKQLNVKIIGSGPETIIFVHGLGGSISFYTPIVAGLGLDKEDSQYTTLLFDLEGHGLSTTKATSKVDIQSYVQDIKSLIDVLDIPTHKKITLVAHSMGCLVASLFASQNVNLVDRLVLIGPPPCPLPAAGVEGSLKRATLVREEGMRNVAIAVATAGTSAKTRADRPLAFTAVQMSLLAQDPEGYAKGCTALASAANLNINFEQIGRKVETLIITGDEDKISPPAHVQKLAKAMGGDSIVLPGVGHWHVFEDCEGVLRAVTGFLLAPSAKVELKEGKLTNGQ
ncbi:hypothetical protein IQ06DRAFT_315423 [Phaeosphaeriaceae sp. SRC1lsM3a]|nr:hypothetical protein IQ06DRAFT_315423 [Stagonospora sp. SRC1lsM3a]